MRIMKISIACLTTLLFAATLDIQSGVNDKLTVAIDGVTATVTLDARVYASASALARWSAPGSGNSWYTTLAPSPR